jgi:hypothetical protein
MTFWTWVQSPACNFDHYVSYSEHASQNLYYDIFFHGKYNDAISRCQPKYILYVLQSKLDVRL